MRDLARLAIAAFGRGEGSGVLGVDVQRIRRALGLRAEPQPDLPTLVNDVYTVRMNGGTLPPDQMGALTGWVQTVPAPPAPASSKSLAATRGQALFERSDVGCTACH